LLKTPSYPSSDSLPDSSRCYRDSYGTGRSYGIYDFTKGEDIRKDGWWVKGRKGDFTHPAKLIGQ